MVLIWHTQIDDTEKYLVNVYHFFFDAAELLMVRQARLTRTINDFLNVTAACVPSILITKPKFHFLVHLPTYICCFGPAIMFSTEQYESFNHVFRLTCIHSNRLAPSRDTCKTFARHDMIRHIATGGFWFDQQRGQWVCCGADAIEYLPMHPQQSRLFGLPTNSEGSGQLSCIASDCRLTTIFQGVQKVTLVGNPKNKKAPPRRVLWRDTRSSKLVRHQISSHYYYLGSSLRTSGGDVVHVDRHVIFRTDGNDKAGKAPALISVV